MTSKRAGFRRAALVAATFTSILLVPTLSAPAGAAVGGLDEPVVVAAPEAMAAARTPAAFQERPGFTYTACPEMTDSIYRLYSAYFLRVPDEAGFDFWLDEYSAGNWSLPRISAAFEDSPEFDRMYGDLTNAEFVDLIYRNIFGRQPDSAGFQFWLDRIENEGMTRGTVMLNFSESPEYIAQTGTVVSLFGNFGWYQAGTTWYCGYGDVDAAMPESPTHIDFLLWNANRGMVDVSLSVLVDGGWETGEPVTLESGYLYSFFSVPFTDGMVDGLALQGSGDFGWIMVFSPVPTPTVRAGWTPI